MLPEIEMPTYETVRTCLEQGISEFLRQEGDLFEAQVGERALTGTLARYLQRTFAPWTTDAEYDRHGNVSKRSRIGSRGTSKYRNGHRVIPDIIVHQRLQPDSNLLAIEAKSEGNQRGTEDDREKLASYLVEPLRYRYVALLVFSCTNIPACCYELFQQGENPLTPTAPIWLRV